jgi:hypothetical protein
MLRRDWHRQACQCELPSEIQVNHLQAQPGGVKVHRYEPADMLEVVGR